MQNPASKVELRSVIGYRVVEESPCEDLVSVALRFSPTFVPVEDRLGLASPAPVSIDECHLAEKALKRVAKRKDADQILAENEVLLHEMVEGTAALLEEARYDKDAYRAWLQDS